MFSCIMEGIIAIFGPESQKSTLSVKVSGFCLSSLQSSEKVIAGLVGKIKTLQGQISGVFSLYTLVFDKSLVAVLVSFR